MQAKEILQSITKSMTKAAILAEVSRARAELDLVDTAQVAQRLGVSPVTVHKRAAYHKIGTLIAKRARVYSPKDIEALEKVIGRKGPKETTVEMSQKMRVMRDHGFSLAQIARAFEISESYVSKLLKVKG